MSTKVKVWKDEGGLYVKHKNQKVRPRPSFIIDMAAYLNQGVGESRFEDGQTVTKNHIDGTNYFEISNDTHEEIWFAQGDRETGGRWYLSPKEINDLIAEKRGRDAS